MNCKTVNRILSDTSYIRTGGSQEEKKCAEYLKSICAEMELNAKIESFPVTMYEPKTARLIVDDKEISCTGYFGAKNGIVESKLYYLSSNDDISLRRCKDKIVLVDSGVGCTLYDKLVENGAKGFITYNGNLYFDDTDIDQREVHFEIRNESFLPAVNIHVSNAFDIVKNKSKSAKIILDHSSYIGNSHNVILDLEGQTEETIIISAHYDSTEHSVGAYDNMSGCIGLLYLAEYFSLTPHHRRIRLLWCGSEERGLLGSQEYCRMHESELDNTILNINLDMLGSVMGGFTAFSCVNEEMSRFITRFLSKHRFPASVRHEIRSSDSNSFVYSKVPAVSFARYAPNGTKSVHTRYDTPKMVSADRLLSDMKIIAQFTEYFTNTLKLPVSMEISEKIKTDVEKYMTRKLPAVKNKNVLK